eukprot:3548689-Rhodomonas_salina.1
MAAAGKGGSHMRVVTTGSAGSSRSGTVIQSRSTLFEHGVLPVPSSMPTLAQLCEMVGRFSSGGRGGDGAGKMSMAAWHKLAKESFKLDTGYAQLVFDIFFDCRSDGNISDVSEVSVGEFAIYLYILAVFK